MRRTRVTVSRSLAGTDSRTRQSLAFVPRRAKNRLLSMSIETSSGSGTLRRSVHRKRVAEHRPAALGLLLSRLVLDDVPVFDKDTILDPEDVRRDPVHGRPEPRKTPMNDDEVAISYDHPGLVLQRRRHALDEVEEALAARGNMRDVLDVVRRPEPFRRRIVSLVEQCIEGLKYERLIPLRYRLTH